MDKVSQKRKIMSENHRPSSKPYNVEYLFRYVKTKHGKKNQYQGYLRANALCVVPTSEQRQLKVGKQRY